MLYFYRVGGAAGVAVLWRSTFPPPISFRSDHGCLLPRSIPRVEKTLGYRLRSFRAQAEEGGRPFSCLVWYPRDSVSRTHTIHIRTRVCA